MRCEQNYLGLLDDNILQAVTDVSSESDCWELCTDYKDCSFYTYFQSSHSVFPQMCFLLDRQQGPYHNCQAGCYTPRHDQVRDWHEDTMIGGVFECLEL